MALENTETSQASTHNQAGCPYLNQSGSDAVQDWAGVLARLKALVLPEELQGELQQLQARCVGGETCVTVR